MRHCLPGVSCLRSFILFLGDTNNILKKIRVPWLRSAKETCGMVKNSVGIPSISGEGPPSVRKSNPTTPTKARVDRPVRRQSGIRYCRGLRGSMEKRPAVVTSVNNWQGAAGAGGDEVCPLANGSICIPTCAHRFLGPFNSPNSTQQPGDTDGMYIPQVHL